MFPPLEAIIFTLGESKTAASVSSAGAKALIYALDLREPRSTEIVVKGTLDRLGRIDALLNIAGAVPKIDLFEMSDAQWDDGMALKLHGARRLTIQAWDALKASNGSVVLISGSAALDPKPGFAAVAAINAATIALAKQRTACKLRALYTVSRSAAK